MLPFNPIETNSNGLLKTSDTFGENPQIIRVIKRFHGHVPGDLVAITGIEGNPGGIPNDVINNLHEVISATFDYFTVKVTTPATMSQKAGGGGMITDRKPFEVLNVTTGAMTFGNTTLTATTRAANAMSHLWL